MNVGKYSNYDIFPSQYLWINFPFKSNHINTTTKVFYTLFSQIEVKWFSHFMQVNSSPTYCFWLFISGFVQIV